MTKMKQYNKLCLFLCIFVYITMISARQLRVFSLDKSWICNIKKTCLDCLHLPQCVWCRSENKCFSDKILQYKNYCKEDKIRHMDLEMSLEENAKCACDPDHLAGEKVCQYPKTTIVSECSGRGTCECGRCFCDTIPDTENPSKTITGKYCEYDNFSCNDTKCNEGPYNIYELQTYEENLIFNGD